MSWTHSHFVQSTSKQRELCSPSLKVECLQKSFEIFLHGRFVSPLQFTNIFNHQSVQSLSCVRLFVTPWTAAHQASLSITNSQSLLKLISIESVMPSNHLILCCHLLLPPSSFPASGSFPVSQFFTSGGQSIGVSASASVLPMNIQGWFPLG